MGNMFKRYFCNLKFYFSYSYHRTINAFYAYLGLIFNIIHNQMKKIRNYLLNVNRYPNFSPSFLPFILFKKQFICWICVWNWTLIITDYQNVSLMNFNNFNISNKNQLLIRSQKRFLKLKINLKNWPLFLFT